MVFFADKHADIDDVQASLIVVYKETTEEYPIRGAWDVRNQILDIKNGDIFNIQSLGRLKVIQVRTVPRNYGMLSLVDVIISARWIDDAWDYKTTALVASTMQSVRAAAVILEQAEIDRLLSDYDGGAAGNE